MTKIRPPICLSSPPSPSDAPAAAAAAPVLNKVTAPDGCDPVLSDRWRLKLKAPLKRYDLWAGHDAFLDGVTLEARAGRGWVRLVYDVTPAMAGGGRFRIDFHLQQHGDTPVEWVALLREERGDQRFHARPSSKLAGSGRVSLSATVDPPEPGVAYVLALSLAAFPVRVAVSAVTCLPLDGTGSGEDIDPFDRIAAARTVQAYLWDDFYTAAHGFAPDTPLGALVAHFLDEGAARDLSPNPMFHAPFYRHQLAVRRLAPVPPGESAFLHWLAVGRAEAIVPTALFDAEEYCAANAVPETTDAYDHYLSDGFRRDFAPSQFFDARWYARRYAIDPSVPAIVHYATVGAKAGYAPAPDLPPPDRGLSLDVVAATLRVRAARLPQALIAKAALIDPQIMRPLGPRRLTMAPLKHSSARPAHAGLRVQRALAGRRFASIVLIPQVRLAGSARVAGALAAALAALSPDEAVLVVSTERADFERADWFPPEAVLLNLPALLGPDMPDDIVPVLLDLARGIRPRRVFNVNSASGWRLLARFGRQLGLDMALYSYLFTWDMDEAGTRTGYPISALPLAFDALDAALVDNRQLADELAERYALSPDAAARRLPVLWSPGDASPQDCATRFGARRDGRLRCLWAGRFDRQKRLDLVLALARLRPGLDIDVYGKAVLGDTAVDLTDLPPNVTLKGVFTSLDELDLAGYDLFLYTAAWDGLPTILIDMGMRGLAIVASAVGGVVDLIDGETGWPVAAWADPAAYADAIDAMLGDPGEVHRRAATLRRRAHRRHAGESYHAALAHVLARDGRDAAGRTA